MASRDRRHDAATATIGLAGVGSAGVLRHQALVDAYGEKTSKPIKRPKLAAELRMLKHPRGRGRWLAGAALGAVSIPPAAVGTSRLINKREDRKHTFVEEGLLGARESLRARNQTLREKPPVKLAVGNYLAGAAVGSAAGGATHHLLSRTRFPGGARSGLASAAGVVAGAATLPLQSKLTQRASRGQFEVTPTGVRRSKTARVPASSKAEVQKMVPRVHGPSVRAGYVQPIRRSKAGHLANEIGTRVGGKWAHGLSQVADAIEAPLRPTVLPKSPVKRKAKALVATGRNKIGETVRTIAYDAAGINDKDKLIREVASGQGKLGVAKTDDPGGNLTRGERRLRVTAAGGPPVIGDFTSAAMAARLSPEKYRRRTAVQQFSGSQVSGLTGNVAGAAGALALASRHKGFDRKATAASRTVDDAKDAVRSKVGLGPATRGPGKFTQRLAASDKVPRLVKTGAKAVARRPGVAAIGALAGGSIAGPIGQQATYGRIMSRDDRYRNANSSARHGSRVVKKADAQKPLSKPERQKLSRRKEHSAVMSVIGGTTGLAALGATLGSSAAKSPRGKQLLGKPRAKLLSRRLGKVPVPALTIGGGIGGANAYTNALIQHREAQQSRVGKAFGLPKMPTPLIAPVGVRRAKTMRRGGLRQTRTSTGVIRTSTVRGGLG